MLQRQWMMAPATHVGCLDLVPAVSGFSLDQPWPDVTIWGMNQHMDDLSLSVLLFKYIKKISK